MTKPTQAQIEAAARAIYDLPVNWRANKPAWEKARYQYIDEAKAALTAAADVRIKENLTYPAGEIVTYELEMQPQAAEVPYAGMQVNKDGLVLKYTDKDLQEIEDITIERCAQVADRFSQRTNSSAWEWAAQEIAAAIRALKEQP